MTGPHAGPCVALEEPFAKLCNVHRERRKQGKGGVQGSVSCLEEHCLLVRFQGQQRALIDTLLLPYGVLDAIASRLESEMEHSIAIIINILAPEMQTVYAQPSVQQSAPSQSHSHSHGQGTGHEAVWSN